MATKPSDTPKGNWYISALRWLDGEISSSSLDDLEAATVRSFLHEVRERYVKSGKIESRKTGLCDAEQAKLGHATEEIQV